MVIVKETDSAGLVTIFYEGLPEKTAVIQEADLTRLKRRKIFVAESEDDDDDSDDDNDGEEVLLATRALEEYPLSQSKGGPRG